MDAMDIVSLAGENILIISPALLIFSALCAADMMVDFAIKIIRSASKHYKL